MPSDIEAIRTETRELVTSKIAPRVAELDSGEPVPRDLIDAMGGAGMFGLTVPEEFGGRGLGHLELVVAAEELARGILVAGGMVVRQVIAEHALMTSGTDGQKEEFLPRLASGELIATPAVTEPNAGSDISAVETTAERGADSWRLLGQKRWIGWAREAGLLVTLARSEGGLCVFLVEKPPGEWPDGLRGERIEQLGYRGIPSYVMTFSNTEVPDTGLLGGLQGSGVRQVLSAFESARIHNAGQAVGVCQAALDAAVERARGRSQYGAPIAELAAVRHRIARMATTTEAARRLTYHAARVKDGGGRCDKEAGMAKAFACEAAVDLARDAMQVWGADGYESGTVVERLYRDAKMLTIIGGTTDVQNEVVGRRVLEG